MITLIDALNLANQVNYDWNKPDTIPSIAPRLNEIKEIINDPNLLPTISLIDYPALVNLLKQTAGYYLHVGREPDEADKYLRLIKSIKYPDNLKLTAEIENLLAFYYQQKAFKANLDGKFEDAVQYIGNSDRICAKTISNLKGQAEFERAFAYCILALNEGEKQVIQEKQNQDSNYKSACSNYEEAFKIYIELKLVDEQYYRAHARYSQFLIKAGREAEAISAFEETVNFWRKFDVWTNPFAHRTFLAYAKSLLEMSSSGKKYNFVVDLDRALVLAEEALAIQQKQFGEGNQDKLKEAKEITADIIVEKLAKYPRDKLDDQLNVQAFSQILEKGEKLAAGMLAGMKKLQLLKQLGISSTHVGQFDKAIKFFARALDLFKEMGLEKPDLESQLKSSLVTEQESKSSDLKNIALKADIYQTRGTTYIRMSNPKLAVKDLAEAQSLKAHLQNVYEPSGFNAWNHTTISFVSAYIYGLAEFSFEEKLSKIPDLDKAAEGYAQQLGNLKDKSRIAFQVAEAHVMKASLYLDCYAAQIQNPSANLKAIQDELDAAEALYQIYLPNHVDRIRLYNKWGYFELLNKNFQAAEKCFKQAEQLAETLKINTHHIFETDFGLKVVYEALGNNSENLRYHNKFAEDRENILGKSANSDQTLAAYLNSLYGLKQAVLDNVIKPEETLQL